MAKKIVLPMTIGQISQISEFVTNSKLSEYCLIGQPKLVDETIDIVLLTANEYEALKEKLIEVGVIKKGEPAEPIN